MSTEAPLVFVSHGSEDKDRFVLPFATSLRENGVNAWVDRWEIRAGQSLVEKIFEEGLKNAHAVLVVLSKTSVNKPWVKTELDAAVVNRINKNSKLIPIVLGELGSEDIPQSLRALKWVSVKDTADFEGALKEVLHAIFDYSEKPAIGTPPPYASPSLHLIPGLDKVDSTVLKLCGDYVANLNHPDDYIKLHDIQTQAEKLGIDKERLDESLEILNEKGYFKDCELYAAYYANFTPHGFSEYGSYYMPNYEQAIRSVGAAIVNDQMDLIDKYCEEGEYGELLVRHAVDWLEQRGFIEVVHYMGGGGFSFTNVSPQLKRWVRASVGS